MADRVIHSDLELFLTALIRQELADLPGQPYAGAFVSNVFWKADPQVPREPPPFQVIIRDDGGPRTSQVTKEASVGCTVLGREEIGDGRPVTDLALIVAAIMGDCASTDPDNPVAAVLAQNGPYKVPDDSGRARRYLTTVLSVVGRPFP